MLGSSGSCSVSVFFPLHKGQRILVTEREQPDISTIDSVCSRDTVAEIDAMFDCKRGQQDARALQSKQIGWARRSYHRPRRQSVSNQQLQRQLEDHVVQPKLTVNEPDDEYEKEAERVAEAVMQMPDPTATLDMEESGHEGVNANLVETT